MDESDTMNQLLTTEKDIVYKSYQALKNKMQAFRSKEYTKLK